MAGQAKLTQIEKSAIEYFASGGLDYDFYSRCKASGYAPQSRQMIAHAAARELETADTGGEMPELLFGGARGGAKSHWSLAQAGIDDCQRYPGIKFLFLRKVGKSAKESLNDLRVKVLRYIPNEFPYGNIVFKNGSTIITGHFRNENDIDQYLGIEYDRAIIEESTQLSPSKHSQIRTCIRTSKPHIRPMIYHTTNPGGVGHLYIKKKFIEPFRAGEQTATRFVPSTVRDNAFVNTEYRRTLEQLTGWLRAAWLDGNWDVFAGQFFSNFNYDDHVFAPDALPHPKKFGLDVWASLDYGFKHYTTCHLFTKYDGEIIVLDEYGARNQLIQTNTAGIKEMLARWDLTPSDLLTFVAGTDVFAKKGDSGTSYADEFATNGIYLRAANTNRIQGAGRIMQLLGDKKQGIAPSVKISSNCRGLIETLPILEHNPNNGMDVLKVDTDDDGNGGDDFFDSFRYGCMAENTNISIG